MKKKMLWVMLILVGLPILVSIWCHFTVSPKGVSFESSAFHPASVAFVYDLTYTKDGETVYEQNIFNAALQLIDEAQEFVLLDLFLFNDDYTKKDAPAFENVCEQLTQALIAKKQANPEMDVTVITDEINTFYGAYDSPWLTQLEEAGVQVIITNPLKIRDSNPAYAGVWRTYLRWLGNSQKGWLPNAFSADAPKVTVRSYLRLLNFKANHRKVLMNEKTGLVTSSNIGHDASSLHSNVGFLVQGSVLADLYNTEQVVATASGSPLPQRQFQEGKEDVQAKVITEKAIQHNLVQLLNDAGPTEQIQMAVFYLADRKVVTALKNAAQRGAKVSIILDANKDAFGLEKNGVPNRPVAKELVEASENIELRWYHTQGEQFHTKFMKITGPEESTIIGGSANYTRRNIGGYNFESNLMLVAPNSHPLATEVDGYFNRLWLNETGSYTLDYDAFEDLTRYKTLMYRFQEMTGLCTF